VKSADRVRYTTAVSVDPVIAFEIFTNEIDSWWKREFRVRFGADSTGKLYFEPGPTGRLLEKYSTGEIFEVGPVHTWKPGVWLIFDWRLRNFKPEESTQVEVIFEKAPGGTRITVEHRGWKALPPNHPARHGLKGPAFYDKIGRTWVDLLNEYRMHSRRKR